jgi:tetratricopeptide (TPR) repeat protein
MHKRTGKQKKHTKRHNLIYRILIGVDDTYHTGIRCGILEYICGILIFISALFTYLYTLTPDIGFHDCGDMVPAVLHLGICHPPGYPLFCLIGKLFISIIPIGNIAYRMNILSAIFASTTVMIVYFLTLRIISTVGMFHNKSKILNIIPGIISAGMLCFATTFWEQAVIAEKYSLNVLFTSLLILILTKWRESLYVSSNIMSYSYLYIFSFILGLSFTHHLQTVYIIPASIYFILVSVYSRLHKPLPIYVITRMFLIFLIPLLLYAYLPIRALAHPPLNWGDPHTLQRFIEYITIQAYKHFIITSPQIWLQNIWEHISEFFPNQFTLWIIWIGIAGMIFLIKQQRIISIMLCLIILTNIGFAIRYGISNIQDYYLPSFMVFAIFIGYGIGIIIKTIIQRISALPEYSMIILLILLVIPFNAHYSHCQHRRYYFSTDIARNLLTPLEYNSVILIKGDVNGFPVWYHRYVENRREDVALIDTPFLFQDWYIEHVIRNFPEVKVDMYPQDAVPGEELGYVRFRDILNKNVGKRCVYHYSDEPIPPGYIGVPYSFFVKIVKKGANLVAELKEGDVNLILREEGCVLDTKARELLRNYAGGYNNRGNTYIRLGEYKLAIYELMRALKIYPELPVVYYNLGRCYTYLNDTPKAVDNFRKALTLNPYQQGVHKAIGSLYERAGKLAQALDEYRREVSISPEDVDTYLAIARISHQLNMTHETIHACEQLVKLKPNNIEFRRNLASLYFKQGRYHDAQREFRKILQIKPDDMYSQQLLNKIHGILSK